MPHCFLLGPNPRRRWWRVSRWYSLLGAVFLTLPAHADWVIPPGSAVDMAGSTVSMGCANVQNQGQLVMGGGQLLGAKDISVDSGASLDVGGGRIELAQQWSNKGTVTVTTGQVVRVGSADCLLVGQAGAIQLTATPAVAEATPVPTMSAGLLALSSAMLALLGARQLRRRARPQARSTPRFTSDRNAS